jgi:hypothetical protein
MKQGGFLMLLREILGVIFFPTATWQRLASQPMQAIKSRLLSILIMAAVPPLSFYYGTTYWGWEAGDRIVKITPDSAIPLMVLFYLALVSAVVVIGLMAHWMSKTYSADSYPLKGIVLVGYSCMPIFVCAFFALRPIWWLDIMLATLACCYAIRLIYMGVPALMNVPEDRGMLYASALFAVALVYAVVILVATVILWEYVALPVFVDG